MKVVTHEAGPVQCDKNNRPLIAGDGQLIYLAKLVMNADVDETVVFLNGDPLDCRRKNLAVVKTASLQPPN